MDRLLLVRLMMLFQREKMVELISFRQDQLNYALNIRCSSDVGYGAKEIKNFAYLLLFSLFFAVSRIVLRLIGLL